MKLPLPRRQDPLAQNQREKSRVWLALPVGAALVGLVAALILNFAIRERQLGRFGLAAEVRPAREAPQAERLADSLLTDSILSIVQSYYVDSGRVDNRGLLEMALASLATNPRVKTGSAPGAVWIEIDGNRRLFPIKEKPRYQDVLEAFTTLAKLVDEAGISLAVGEAPEKGAPGSVTLLNSMLAELDAHSALLSPDAYRELRQGTEGSFGGLGVLVGIRDNLLTVIKPLPHSPAQRAGIKQKDRILGIDGLFTYGYSLDELVEYMRGDPGSEVNLSLLREGATAPSELVLRREIIHVDSVTSNEIEKSGLKVLHLTIENFASRTSREVLSAIKKFRAKHNGVMHGLVLDLRSNPGGLLDQAVQVADLFLEKGVIVTTKGRREEVESADTGVGEVAFPVAVLIDGDSASASEIVAGALQDHGRAVVIGQPSFGKGSVQTIFELPGERALKLTIARYYTPVGRSIQNVGIMPDIWLQPVLANEANENLFGTYRYKNERFLRNHLTVEEAPTMSLQQPTRKAYYLRPAEDQVEEGGRAIDEGKAKPDREMDFALKMFEKLKSTYGSALPNGTDRASHWLGLAGPALNDMADDLDKHLDGWLASRHGIAWRAPTHPTFTPALNLELADDNPQEVVAGAELKVAWTLKNREPFPLERISLFVRSEVPGFETKEVLIGSVAESGSRTGTLTVKIPSYWEEGPLLLRIGAAADAWPAPGAVADYLIQVRQRPAALLSAKATLVDEVGGDVPGVLEGRERGRLRITLDNEGPAAATALKVRVFNLSGSQVAVPFEELTAHDLAPNASGEVFVSVQAAKMLYTPEIAFGLYVESPELKHPLRQRFMIKGQPNADFSAKGIGPTSH